MRMTKIKQTPQNPENMMKKFLLVKEAQHTGEEAMRDYRSCLNRDPAAAATTTLHFTLSAVRGAATGIPVGTRAAGAVDLYFLMTDGPPRRRK